jgi:hypothetical protein
MNEPLLVATVPAGMVATERLLQVITTEFLRLNRALSADEVLALEREINAERVREQ